MIGWLSQARPIPRSPNGDNNQGPGSSKAILKSKDLADLYKNFEEIGFLMRVDKVLILEIKYSSLSTLPSSWELTRRLSQPRWGRPQCPPRRWRISEWWRRWAGFHLNDVFLIIFEPFCWWGGIDEDFNPFLLGRSWLGLELICSDKLPLNQLEVVKNRYYELQFVLTNYLRLWGTAG